MTVALCFLGWFGSACALCWFLDLAKVPGERQQMAWKVKTALWDHYLLSGLPPSKWGDGA